MAEGIPRLRRYDELEGKTLLVCVGGTKCATSWLHGYLHSLHGVVVSPLKEVHFFDMKVPDNALSDVDLIAMRQLGLCLDQEGDPVGNLLNHAAFQAAIDRAQMIYDDNAYFGHFARLCSRSTRVFCDITPAYSALGPEGFTYMRDFCASQDITLKILFVMRDPVERLWSQLRHMQQMTIIEDAAKLWRRALQSAPILTRGDYEAIVTALDGCYAAEDILYLFYEDLMAEPSLQRLCDFIGVTYRPARTGTRRNETIVKTPLPEDARNRFLQALGPQYAFCRARFGAEVPRAWQG